jgi:hypothetical protein
MENEIQVSTNDGRFMLMSASFLSAVHYPKLAQPFLPLEQKLKKIFCMGTAMLLLLT